MWQIKQVSWHAVISSTYKIKRPPGHWDFLEGKSSSCNLQIHKWLLLTKAINSVESRRFSPCPLACFYFFSVFIFQILQETISELRSRHVYFTQIGTSSMQCNLTYKFRIFVGWLNFHTSFTTVKMLIAES